MKKNITRLACASLALASFSSSALDKLSDLPIWISGDFSKVSGDSRESTQAALTRANSGLTITEYDENRVAWSIAGGYQFNPYWSVDLGYLDMGEVTMLASGQTLQPNTGATTVIAEHPITAHGAFIGTSFYHAFNDLTQLQMQFGLWFWKGEYDVDVNGERFAIVKSSGEDVFVNLNVQHEVVEHVSVTAGVRLVAEDAIADPSFVIGARYRF
ncbi:outer membrane beta-barrel protein [Algibacillus agarilyticus]|uniref:outer membrane beta-barrel protein n=1 Tax=Algibacillus agarilyticus TaxID=2234133 RepID=UPI0013004902|nr:outer membrane beta-barrel protein [Algibacillus agarilyticus]